MKWQLPLVRSSTLSPQYNHVHLPVTAKRPERCGVRLGIYAHSAIGNFSFA